MKLVWRSRRTNAGSIMTSAGNSVTTSTTASNVNLTEKIKAADASNLVTEAVTAVALAEKQKPKASKWKWSWKLSKKTSAPEGVDVEKGNPGYKARPIRLFAPFYGGMGAALSLCQYFHSFAPDLP